MPLEKSATYYKQKKFFFFASYFWLIRKDKKRFKSQFVTYFIRVKVTIIFIQNVSLIASKIFATQCSFTDHLKHKIVKLAQCPQQILTSCKNINERTIQLF